MSVKKNTKTAKRPADINGNHPQTKVEPVRYKAHRCEPEPSALGSGTNSEWRAVPDKKQPGKKRGQSGG